MCIIVDANLASDVFNNKKADFIPVLNWLDSDNGKLVINGDLPEELAKVSAALRFIKSLKQAGRVRHISEEDTAREKKQIFSLCKSKSNDQHIIALARASGARLLCSDDGLLGNDFKNTKLINNPQGHIYKEKKHQHLLKRYGHTSACKQKK